MQDHFTTRQVRNLQRGTRAALLFGIVTSISANVLHSLTRPDAATEPVWRLVSAAVLSALAPLVLSFRSPASPTTRFATGPMRRLAASGR